MEYKLDDDGKLKRKFMNKRVNAAKENINFELTYNEYIELVNNANLVSSQLGFTGENYVLARYHDKGPYSKDNCRFITQQENNNEKDKSSITQPVYCIEDEKSFCSIIEAAEYYNVNKWAIKQSLNSLSPIKSINKSFIRLDKNNT